MDSETNFSQEEWDICIKVLQALSKNPESALDEQRLKGLVTKLYKTAKKKQRKQEEIEAKILDNALLSNTILHQYNPLEEEEIPMIEATTEMQESSELKRPQNCYCCKTPYKKVHFFYHALCPACAAINYEKRTQSTDLKGRIALITGGRVKIGYLTALKMLRDGAVVILTTRFPKDAAKRFSEEPDFEKWKHRLEIYGLDLRNIPVVERFIEHLLSKLQALDIIINNAAQTIKRPIGFYQHLLEGEERALSQLPEAMQGILASEEFQASLLEQKTSNLLIGPEAYFPIGRLDKHQQQIDLRPQNSWVLKLEEVDTVEMLEVQLVNAVAPFLFNSKLKPLLLKSTFERKFIINVSAMEGQFNRKNKTPYHPHTNMAKAALNMLTRTVAEDYAKSGIYMNSVDTGWITQENPHPKKMQIREKGFVTPLDEVDGMARIYDPIVQGLNSEEMPIFGQFLKDYQSYPW